MSSPSRKEALDLCDTLGRMWPHNHYHPEETAAALDHIRALRAFIEAQPDRIAALEAEVERLRKGRDNALDELNEAALVLNRLPYGGNLVLGMNHIAAARRALDARSWGEAPFVNPEADDG